MPELPEVETVRSSLEPRLVGRRFERVDILDSRLTRPVDPAEVAAELAGERVGEVGRRGKYLVVRFESGLVLLIHLRMTGTLAHSRNGAAAGSHVRAVVTLDDGSDITYRDVRRFGTWLVLHADELDAYLATRLGLEPLERGFSASKLAERLAGRRAPIKAALPASSMRARSAPSTAVSAERSRPESRARERPSATIGRSTGGREECNMSSRCTDAAASPACAAGHR
ncbi:MAG: hypothetical protein E6G19_07705 [Actinobacteria bacterium]|nr:MAG: hypothetical protein E6G19_07705 [Actinomycetota bacterium]